MKALSTLAAMRLALAGSVFARTGCPDKPIMMILRLPHDGVADARVMTQAVRRIGKVE